jgi:cyclopropane fatty-acyl-phospholipid synthase-like methyltransferase
MLHRAIGPIAQRVDRLLGPLIYTRRYFELRYRNADPWNYLSSAYELKRHELMLAALLQHGVRPTRVLEIGCSEGVLTEKMAGALDAAEIIGVDISALALDRARARCRSFPSVSFALADVRHTLPDGPFDLILSSEVMYYLGSSAELAALRERLLARLSEHGRIMLVHASPEANLFHHRVFARSPQLAIVSDQVERTGPRPYLITVFERRPA